jgi:hypothetical protein
MSVTSIARHSFHRASFALVLVAAASPAGASDGVREISQTCAATGCFTGDLPGLPVEITQPGSYRLTSELAVPNQNTSALVVTASAVSIDLNGFGIRGITACTGAPLVCTPAAGTGSGIDGPLAHRVGVRNGRIVGFGLSGIRLGDGARVEDVTAAENRSHGVSLGRGSNVAHTRALDNGGDGFFLDDGVIVTECVAEANGQDGIDALAGVNVTGSATALNGEAGIESGAGATVVATAARDNGANGMSLGTGSLVSASAATLNTGAGVSVLAGSQILDSVASGNTGTGLVLGAQSGFVGNVMTLNGATVSGGVQTGTNLCNGVTTCP